jgi:RNA polymerase sigma factor (sigma-70 family)
MVSKPEEFSIRELLERCLSSGDQTLWCEFVRRVQPGMAGAICRQIRPWRVPQRDVVDDLVNDTFCKLFDDDSRRLRNIRSEHDNGIFAFVNATAANVAKDELRKPKNIIVPVSLEDVDPPGPDFFSFIEFEMKKEEIDRCLKKLSLKPNFERDYTIFWLFHEQRFTAIEISRLAGIDLTENGVEGVLHRLRKFIKRQLDERGSEPPDDDTDEG